LRTARQKNNQGKETHLNFLRINNRLTKSHTANILEVTSGNLKKLLAAAKG